VYDLSDTVEVAQAGGGLWFVRRQEVWGEVAHCIEQVHEMLPDAVIGVVGARIRTKRERGT
jgi:hypothetical protein